MMRNLCNSEKSWEKQPNSSEFFLNYRELIPFKFLCEYHEIIQILNNTCRGSFSGYTKILEAVFLQLT